MVDVKELQKDLSRPWFSELIDFKNEMGRAIWANMEEKGESWKTCEIEFLKKKLDEYKLVENWVAVGNLAFMLWWRVKHDSLG